jgi:hypothetical protein
LPDKLPETTIPPCEGVVGENEMPFSVNVPLINDPDEGAEKLTGPPCSLGTEPVRAPGAAIMVTAFADEPGTSRKTAALRETNRLFTVAFLRNQIFSQRIIARLKMRCNCLAERQQPFGIQSEITEDSLGKALDRSKTLKLNGYLDRATAAA